MKKFFGLVALAAALVGCKTIPSVETMHTTSYGIGAAAGLVASQVKIDEDTKPIIVEVVCLASTILPAPEQSFEDAFKTAAETVTAKYLEDGKITEAQKTLIVSATTIAGKGVDFLFNYRYKEARKYTDLVQSGLSGFAEGFQSTFKVEATEIKDFRIDVEAYEWLKSQTGGKE